MPVVPKLQSNVQDANLPNVRFQAQAPEASFGSGEGISQALQGVGKDIAGIAQDEKRSADDAVTQEIQAGAVKIKNKLLYDVESGALSKKGKAAFNVVQEYGDLWNKEFDKIISEGTFNDDQKAVAYRIKNQYGNELNGTLSTHSFQETNRFKADTFKNGLEANQADAADNYQNPGKVEESLRIQQAYLDSYASDPSSGIAFGSDQYKNMQNEITSKTHSAVLTRMVSNGQDVAASSYFNQNKKSIHGNDLIQIEKLVSEGSIRGESQRIVESYAGLSSEEVKNKIKEIEEPKLKDAVYDRYKAQQAFQKSIEQDAREKKYQQVSDIVVQSKGTYDLDPTQLQGLSPSEISSLYSLRDKILQGVQPESFSDDYYSLRTMASNPGTKEDFMKTNLREYKRKVTDSELEQLVDLQTQMRGGDGKADPILDGYRTNSEIVNSTLNEVGIDPTPKDGTDDAARVNRFRAAVDRQIVLRQQATGKKVSTSEVEEIANDLATKVITDKGWLFDTKKRAFELDNPEFEAIDIKEVPRAERAKIEDYLRKSGYPISNKSIIELYSQKLKGRLRGR